MSHLRKWFLIKNIRFPKIVAERNMVTPQSWTSASRSAVFSTSTNFWKIFTNFCDVAHCVQSRPSIVQSTPCLHWSLHFKLIESTWLWRLETEVDLRKLMPETGRTISFLFQNFWGLNLVSRNFILVNFMYFKWPELCTTGLFEPARRTL